MNKKCNASLQLQWQDGSLPFSLARIYGVMTSTSKSNMTQLLMDIIEVQYNKPAPMDLNTTCICVVTDGQALIQACKRLWDYATVFFNS